MNDDLGSHELGVADPRNPLPSGTGSDKYTVDQMRRARELLTHIHAARRAARFYPFEHPAVDAAVGSLERVVRTYHEEHVDVQLLFLDGEVLLGEQLLTEESVLFDQLVRDLIGAGIGSIVFRQGMTRAELTRAMRVLAANAEEIDHEGGIEMMTASADLSLVEIRLVGVIAAGGAEHLVQSEDVRAAFGKAVSLIHEIQRSLSSGSSMLARHVTEVTNSLVDGVLSDRDAMLQMTCLKNHDEYTYYHSANVAILSVALGSTITRDSHFLSSLCSGALLHDIGKLAVGEEIVEKPGRLDPEEWERMRQHPLLGTQRAVQMQGVDSSALVPILEHHMGWDGSGYPSRTPRRKQHLMSRIVAVADSYDAMTSRRSYSVARPQDEAMRIVVESAGVTLDPLLVKLFVRMLGAYPPRTMVLLSDGRIGIVLAPCGTDPFHPVVRVLTDVDAQMVMPEDVRLTERPGIDIVGLIDPHRLDITVDDYL